MGRGLGSCLIWHGKYGWGRKSMGGDEEDVVADIQQYEEPLGLIRYNYSD